MFYLFTLLFLLHSILIAKNEMRCKYTKLFGKFAAYCKFLVFLGEICSALQISFCRTDNTFCKTDNLSIICISENLYLFSFLHETSYSFYRPIHHVVGVYISRCRCYHTDEIHAGEGCLPGVACQIKHCHREEIRA